MGGYIPHRDLHWVIGPVDLPLGQSWHIKHTLGPLGVETQGNVGGEAEDARVH